MHFLLTVILLTLLFIISFSLGVLSSTMVCGGCGSDSFVCSTCNKTGVLEKELEDITSILRGHDEDLHARGTIDAPTQEYLDDVDEDLQQAKEIITKLENVKEDLGDFTNLSSLQNAVSSLNTSLSKWSEVLQREEKIKDLVD